MVFSADFTHAPDGEMAFLTLFESNVILQLYKDLVHAFLKPGDFVVRSVSLRSAVSQICPERDLHDSPVKQFSI